MASDAHLDHLKHQKKTLFNLMYSLEPSGVGSYYM